MTSPGQPSSARCAPLHAALGVDPAGTAPHWDAVLIVEVPGPWPRDISLAEPFASLCDAPSATITGQDGRVWRPQGVMPVDPGDGVRVMARERHVGPRGEDRDDRSRGHAGPFELREWLMPPDSPESVLRLCSALIRCDDEALGALAELRDDPAPGTVDVLLCTHGTRDICCGGSGTSLHAALLAALEEDPVEGLRIWRSTHEGGHRFAPTALSFPEGVSWSHLDLGTLLAVARRDPCEASLAGHVRGAVSVEGPQAQVADREGFVVHGWEWFAGSRQISVAAHDPQTLASAVEVAMCPGGPNGSKGPALRVDVELAGYVPQPPCGVVDPPEVPSEPVWRVARSASTSEPGGDGGGARAAGGAAGQ